jgi:hypothetical protein
MAEETLSKQQWDGNWLFGLIPFLKVYLKQIEILKLKEKKIICFLLI